MPNIAPAIDTQSCNSRPNAELRAVAGPQCHSLLLSLKPNHDCSSLQSRWRTLLQDNPALQGVQPALWVQELSGCADSEAAQRHRQRELRRAVQPAYDSGVRAVLLRYTDGGADFILVSSWRLLNQRGLYQLAEACLAGTALAAQAPQTITRVPLETALAALRTSGLSPRPDWNIAEAESGIGRLRHTMDHPCGHAVVLTALGRVLASCYRQRNSAVWVLQQCAAGGALLGSNASEPQVVCLECTPESTAAAATADVAAQLRSAPITEITAVLEALRSQAGEACDITIGVVLPAHAAPQHDAVQTWEYLPCLVAQRALTLVLHDTESAEGRIEAVFDRSVFSTTTVDWLLSCVVHVAGVVSRKPEAQMASLPLLSPQRQRELLRLAAAPGTAFTLQPERIEQALQHAVLPHAHKTALTCEGDSLSYAQLIARANRLAHLMRHRGVAPGSFVGLCIERGPGLIISMLAVLKAGAAYVPMDPMYPDDRLVYTCTDAGLALLITTRTDLPAIAGIELRELNSLLEEAQDFPATAPAIPGANAEDAAYMIYTSGSTGKPKGVVVSHRNVLALLETTRQEFALHAGDVWTLFHSSAFDFSVWEIWACLLSAARLVIVPYWVTRSPEKFRDLLIEQRVTVLNQTPSAFAQLMAVDERVPLGPALRLVIFGGEPLDARALLPWFDRHAENTCRLVNMFGITETTVHVTYLSLRRRHALTASRSVGRPIPGWHCHVLDEWRHLLPPGVPGEIHVSGMGVALRYHNRHELTAERFVTAPFDGARMYRSGDRGRILPDGELEHLGRLDSQIKLRGFRIELEEIRTVLLSIEGVRAASVVFRQGDPLDSASARLDAYVVLADVTVNDVRARVKSVLPEFMVPSNIVALEQLPLTTNGKLDVAKLPAPKAAERTTTPSTAAPAGSQLALADAMVAMWSDVLRTQVKLDDNFFDLGGNSLYAVRLIEAARERGLPALDPRQLYLHQTVRKLVATLEMG